MEERGKSFWSLVTKKILHITTAHPWCGGHFTSISALWGVGVKGWVQVFRRELQTHIHLE